MIYNKHMNAGAGENPIGVSGRGEVVGGGGRGRGGGRGERGGGGKLEEKSQTAAAFLRHSH
jgi:hypothetical protein